MTEEEKKKFWQVIAKHAIQIDIAWELKIMKEKWRLEDMEHQIFKNNK